MFKDKSYLKDLLAPLTVTLVFVALLFYFSPWLAIGSGCAAVFVLVWQTKRRHQQKEQNWAAYLGGLTAGVEQASFYAVSELPLAIVVFDAKDAVRWRNKLCEEWFPCDADLLDLEHCLPGLTRERFEQ